MYDSVQRGGGLFKERTYSHVTLNRRLLAKHSRRMYFKITIKFPLIFIQNCDNFRFLGYVLTFSHFGNDEINKILKFLGREWLMT